MKQKLALAGIILLIGFLGYHQGPLIVKDFYKMLRDQTFEFALTLALCGTLFYTLSK